MDWRWCENCQSWVQTYPTTVMRCPNCGKEIRPHFSRMPNVEKAYHIKWYGRLLDGDNPNGWNSSDVNSWGTCQQMINYFGEFEDAQLTIEKNGEVIWQAGKSNLN